MMPGSWLRVTLKVLFVLLLGIFVQTTFGSDLTNGRVNDVAPDFMLLLAI